MGKIEIRINNIVLGGVFNNQDKKFVENYSKNVPLGGMANKGECIPPILFTGGWIKLYNRLRFVCRWWLDSLVINEI
ncbi:hypothetical protein CM15mP35_01490 [bacterium]|nr:MAG: hypothetical protein CM15mP35_01490 [bacterium]